MEKLAEAVVSAVSHIKRRVDQPYLDEFDADLEKLRHLVLVLREASEQEREALLRASDKLSDQLIKAGAPEAAGRAQQFKLWLATLYKN